LAYGFRTVPQLGISYRHSPPCRKAAPTAAT
jgi:hypothetical protein